MFHLGVETTRALSLIASRSETVMRPWYSDASSSSKEPDLDTLARRLLKEQRDVNFDELPEEVKEQVRTSLKMQMSQGGRNPNIMQQENCAITCRVARSFLRVGHIDLFSRRARQGDEQSLQELKLIIEHALAREYPDVEPGKPLQVRAVAMLQIVSQRLAKLAADWVRVGYVQGNFNADNCLVGGRTMDYGPFGFVERYEPLWNMWVGGAEKYGFLNQPNAAFKNFETLAKAIMPVLDEAHCDEVNEIIGNFGTLAKRELSDVWRRKLGLAEWNSTGEAVFTKLEPLLRAARADYTIFWRSLANAAENSTDMGPDALLQLLRPCLYEDLSSSEEEAWVAWMQEWLAAIRTEDRPVATVASQMREASPKYVPREWMLVEAYNAASQDNHAPLKELQSLFREPYAEQPQFEERFYCRIPPEAQSRGGTAFMT